MLGKLCLLGTPRVEQSEGVQTLNLNKPTLLLLYLAYQNNWVSRSEVAFLFRPDDDEVTALTQLRLLLHRAKPYAWAQTLEALPQQLRFSAVTDVLAFKAAIEQQDWEKAIELYQGPLLGSYSPLDLPTYGAWLELERSNLQNAYEDALLYQAQVLESQNNYQEASTVLQELLRCDPLAETVVQAYIRTSYLAGQAEKALEVYRTFHEAVQKELGLEPLPQTQALVQSIQGGKALISPGSLPNPIARRPSPLPAQATRFIGRKQELQDLSQRLGQPDCRLLTLMGLGGTGKTRLALEVAQHLQNSFADGVQYAPLAALNSAEALIPYLTQVFNLRLAPGQDPKAQLLGYLSDKNLLLVLDNFEHLLSTVPTIAELLQSAHSLKILITSRQSLKLSSEWLYDLQGMSYPDSSEAESAQGYDAVQLFLSSAKRVAPQLGLGPDDLLAVATVCQTLQGHPLAIELAAGWTRIMPIAQIARELQQDYGLLESDLADIPERHRSLENILDKTWEQLSQKKQETLARLSVFVGGCTLEAAEVASGTRHSLLLALVNESLLSRGVNGRFDMHTLVRHYATNKLTASEFALSAAQQHSDFFRHRLEQFAPGYQALDYTAHHQMLVQDLDNIHLAWSYAQQHAPQSLTVRSLNTLYRLFHEASRYQELIDLLEAMPEGVPAQATLVARVHLAELLAETGHFDKALSIFEQLPKPDIAGAMYAEFVKASLDFHFGKLEDGLQAAHRAVELAKEMGDPRQTLKAKIKLASIFQQMGRTREAIELLGDDLAYLKTVLPNRDYLAALVSQGAHYGLLGNLALGKDLLEESIRVAKGLNDRYHHIAAATSLMFILNAMGNNTQAARIAEEALGLGSFEFSDALRTNLSHIYLALEQYDRAEHHLQHIAQHCPDPTFVTISRARLASLYQKTGQPNKAHHELDRAIEHLGQTEIGAALVTVSVAVFNHGHDGQKQKMLNRLELLDMTRLSQTDQEKLRTALKQYRPDHPLNQT